MNALATKETAAAGPTVHLEFIQNQAGLPEAEGLEAVDAYHRAVFMHHHARDFERFQQQGRIHTDRLNHLEGRLSDINARLSGHEKLVPVKIDGEPDIEPTAPWNIWDRAMFVAALLGVLSLLVFGVLNISFNLLESGLVTFVESPIRAYFWAALLPVGALAVKVGWDFLQSRQKRETYVWVCLSIGVVGVLVWMSTYAMVYPTLSRSTADQIEGLSVFGNSTEAASATAAGVKWTDVIIVASQATAEIFLSAVLGIYMTMIYMRHRPVRLAENPMFMQLEQERRLLGDEVERERIALAEAKGSESRLQNQLNALVSYAKSLFQHESALRRDQLHQKRLLLDQISEQLRSQLQTMQNNSLPEIDRGGSSYVLGRDHASNGK
jgi:hypothetical protein